MATLTAVLSSWPQTVEVVAISIIVRTMHLRSLSLIFTVASVFPQVVQQGHDSLQFLLIGEGDADLAFSGG